ncbi:polyisoprenoid-binding protein YceI [Chitinivorax tropicus]|uniref:Polyisoprenoid-binding protein YceI n=1 Tax=Chitinivorax tropicus TaxID=714531 RepID=A0A840MNN5_9PROT|nr:YceI family protein [Chitinivorax tropicus]MBB5018362.1 polyisoprenoid-binding protein YceI [Chitinivorax tropicus]
MRRFVSLLSGLLWLSTTAAEPLRYQLDPDHSYPHFSIRHLGISALQGRFNKMAGWVELDQEAKTGRLEITVEVGSLDTGMPARDRNLLKGVFGTTFFEPDKYPHMQFRASEMGFDGELPASISGELTIQGITRTAAFQIRQFNCAFNPLRLAKGCGAQAVGKIKRSDFGMGGMLSLIGDEVELIIDLEAYPEHAGHDRPNTK